MQSHKLINICEVVFLILFIVIGGKYVCAEELENSGENWKTVRVSCGINNALYLDEAGQPAGYCSEYLNQLAKINHWNLQYVEGSWNESVQKLQDGTIDLLFPTQMTEEREKTMGFSESIGGYQPIGLFAKSDSELYYDDYKGFDGARIAVSEGTSNEAALKEYAKENNFTYETVYLNSVEDKLDALNNGTVDMIVFSTLNDVFNGKVVAMIDYLPFYYCTNINNTELLEELDYGMNQLLIRKPELVQNVYYSFMNKDISFAFTAEENQAIKETKKVIVGVYKDTAPLFDVDKDGNYTGIYADVLEKIEEKSGLTVEIMALDRSHYVFDYLDHGQIDFVMGSSDQALLYAGKEGEDYVQSDSVLDYITVAITLPEYQFVDDGKMTFALTNGRKYWTTYLNEKYPNAAIIYCETPKDCLEAVQSGKADVTLLNSWEYNYQSKNPRFQQMMEWENFRLTSNTIMVSKNTLNPQIRSVIDKAIDQISEEDKAAIINYNLNMPYHAMDFRDKLYSLKDYLFMMGFVLLSVVVVFLVYISMRRKSMTQLEEKNKQLIRANTSKNRFLSRMSHELRTPLNAITGYASLMEESVERHELDEEAAKRTLENILRSANYQLAIIGDLLEIQKIESGQFALMKEEVDSKEYMENIVHMIQPEADKKKIHFSYERLSQINDTYYLDGIRFQQVILNLLHNAIKFTPEGGTVKMTAEVMEQGEKTNKLRFVISDTGIGMSKEFQETKLFQSFAQEYAGNTSPYEGCGIGLAISREIIHLMGGEISCQSTKGKGSTFTIMIQAEYMDRKGHKREKKKSPNYDLENRRILLCEDNHLNQDMERRLLEKMKGIVDIADDGQIGLEKFQTSELNYYDIILMDIRMPNMDGLEATRRIRALERKDAATIPILAVSANAFEEDVEQSIKAGMNEHLSKPVDVRLLYTKIMEYCEKKF